MKKFAEIGGYFGMVMLQGAGIPPLVAILFNGENIDMPLYYIAMIIFGLFLYLIHSIVNRILLYTISNSIGLSINSLLAFIIIQQ